MPSKLKAFIFDVLDIFFASLALGIMIAAVWIASI